MFHPEGDPALAGVPREVCPSVEALEDLALGNLASAGLSQPKLLCGVHGLNAAKWLSPISSV